MLVLVKCDIYDIQTLYFISYIHPYLKNKKLAFKAILLTALKVTK